MQKPHQDLTDRQWQVIKKLVDDGRKRKICLKAVFSACLWLTGTGCQWRNLAQSYYPKWQTVRYYFYKWQKKGTWQQCLSTLVIEERQRQDRQAQPCRLAVDSQSVKQCGCFSTQVGVDVHKKIDGRKRHLAVDSLGLPWAIYVGAAHEADGIAGLELLPQCATASQRLSLICADSAYQGSFVTSAAYYGWRVDITQKPPSRSGFIPQKGRWQVERSFSWWNHYRRLSKDYERTTQSAVSFIQLAFITILLAKIP
jgi:transposase